MQTTKKLALACTIEYSKAATGLAAPTKAQVLAKMVTSMNRVNGVYEMIFKKRTEKASEFSAKCGI